MKTNPVNSPNFGTRLFIKDMNKTINYLADPLTQMNLAFLKGMGINPLGDARCLNNLSEMSLVPYSVEKFKKIRGMEDFTHKQVDEFCKTVTNFNEKISADGNDRFALEIANYLDEGNLIVSSLVDRPPNSYVPLREFIPVPLAKLKPRLENEYSRLINA